MSKKRKKAASLSSSLLSQDGKEPTSGFVISLVDRLKESQEATGPRSGPARRGGGKSAPAQPRRPAAPVDSADDVGPQAAVEGGDARKAARPGTTRKPPRVATPRPRRRSGDAQPPTQIDEESASDEAQHLVQALRQGEIARAEALFGRMTGLSGGSVRRVLYGAEGQNLAIACRALGIDQLQFISIFMLSRRLGLGEAGLEPRQLTQIVEFFDRASEASARKKLNQWLCYAVD
jgi:hypothetical protein